MKHEPEMSQKSFRSLGRQCEFLSFDNKKVLNYNQQKYFRKSCYLLQKWMPIVTQIKL